MYEVLLQRYRLPKIDVIRAAVLRNARKVRGFGRYNQVWTVQQRFLHVNQAKLLVPHSATARGRSHTTSRIRGRTDHCEDLPGQNKKQILLWRGAQRQEPRDFQNVKCSKRQINKTNTLVCPCCCFLYCMTWAVRQIGLHRTSKDAENYGKENNPLRWARCHKILEKKEKLHPFGGGEE